MYLITTKSPIIHIHFHLRLAILEKSINSHFISPLILQAAVLGEKVPGALLVRAAVLGVVP